MERKYYKHKIENLLIINEIVTIHYFEFAKDFCFNGESHDFWELVYADKENIIVNADGKEIVLNEGEVLFHKPNVFHSLSANFKTAPNVFIMSFVCKSQAMHFFEDKIIKLDKSLLKFIYSIIEESKKTFNIPYSNPELKKMELLDKPTLGGEQIIKNYLEILLINIMRSETEKENSNEIFLLESDFKNRVSNQVMEILKQNVKENLKMETIAEKLCYNKSYIYRQFKKDTGLTIMSYFTKLKIEYAKRLLREGNLNITQIATELCFDTPNYFSKTFKKVYGMSPLKYKKIHSLPNAK
ncbi:MAG: helix-turn-helix transcriptional regulator [Clostridia bacterium]|nr:helix-turn-helix transcriptional regulator [Clostridia bacterium]